MSNVAFDVTRYYQLAQDTTGVNYLVQDGNWYLASTQAAINIVPNGWKFLPMGASATYPGLIGPPQAQGAVPMYLPPSGFMANNGVFVIGQAPSSSATVSFSAASGTVTMTFSAATLLGTAADVGRILTILDGTTYKYATITVQSSTTVATATLSATLSGTGPFANNIIWLSGTPTSNTTAFSVPMDFAFAAAYFQFPAGAISAASLVGQYFVQMQSTTVGTVFNNLYTSGTPTIPAAPTPFVTTGPGAYTQTTGALQTMISSTTPGGAMGANGCVKVTCMYQNNNGSGSKTFSIKFGGSQTFGSANTTNQTLSIIRELYNCGATNSQMSASNGIAGTGVAAGNTQRYSKDTTASQPNLIQVQLAQATDWVGVDSFRIEVIPGA